MIEYYVNKLMKDYHVSESNIQILIREYNCLYSNVINHTSSPSNFFIYAIKKIKNDNYIKRKNKENIRIREMNKILLKMI
jgi:hypothetical protein